MARVQRIFAVVALLGFGLAFFGGLLGGPWVGVGGVMAVIGLIGFWGYRIWNRLPEAEEAFLDPDEAEPPSIIPAAAEEELRRKDHGSELRVK